MKRSCLSQPMLLWLILACLLLPDACFGAEFKPLPNTAPLMIAGDIASNLVAGVDRFLLREIEGSIQRRAQHWQRDFSSPENYARSVETNRQRLAHILGVRDPRPAAAGLEFVSQKPGTSRVVAQGVNYEVYEVRWPAFGDVHGEGLLLLPTVHRPATEGVNQNNNSSETLSIIAIPDADQTPEQIAGLAPGVPVESQYARRLAENGCTVLIPALINRSVIHRRLSNREFLYRAAFELGRHLIGYEIQKVIAGLDNLKRISGSTAKLGVMGWGEGGLLALYTGALDPRVEAVCVSGYFDSRQNVWQEPVYRNIFGLLHEFGDAELASLIAPRALIIEAARGPEIVVPPGTGGAPGRLTTSNRRSVQQEIARARQLLAPLKPAPAIELVVSEQGTGPFGSPEALSAFLRALSSGTTPKPPSTPTDTAADQTAALVRQQRQLHELDRHNQGLLSESPYVRQQFMTNLDTRSLEKYQSSVSRYRDYFYNEIIGRFDYPLLAPNPRSRLAYTGTNWTGYEVVLDVFPDVIAYGILLVPNNLKAGEKRPVVVCQHGLEGRPQDVIGTNSYQYYKAFAAQLAQEGFVTFAPQNLYLFQDRFRTLQRKANPLKKTLFSIIVPQHQQITDWLKSLPFVDGNRIAFYGLSYGGKTAMRVPPLVSNYCLSICSADFNEWVWKNASSRSPYSYVWTGEYEIFEFDLGSTFNYAEMAALIAPRPFMVERGHFDGVAPDEAVAYEFAKVRHLYEAKLGLSNRCRIEWFVGPHSINGQGTFQFLRENLRWPE